jgi:hypothetical protein
LFPQFSSMHLPIATGCIPHRRRENSILQQEVVRWRLHHKRIMYVASSHDVANAFPSVSHCKLDDEMDRRTTKVERQWLKQRYRWATMTMKTDMYEDPFVISDMDEPQSQIQMAIGSGSLQGDSIATEQFGCVYQPTVQKWIECTADDRMTATTTIFGNSLSLDLSTTLYADDVFRIHIVDQFWHVTHLAAKSNVMFDVFLDQLDMAQHKKKIDTIIHLVGVGSRDTVRRICASAKEYLGNISTDIRLLGVHIHHECSFTPERHRRIAAAGKGFFAMGRFWYTQSPRRSKLVIFHCMVVSANLSS